MNRKQKIIRNVVLIVILFFVFIRCGGLYLTPLSAHENSERSIHYGPSEILHIEDFDKGKYILCKYDKWVSCNTVNRVLFFLWRFGDQPIGFENDLSKIIDYSGSLSYDKSKIYGIINDEKVKTIQVILKNGTVLEQSDFYDDLFLITWDESVSGNWGFKCIKAYDENNQLIYEEEK